MAQIVLDAAPCFADLLDLAIRFLCFKGGRGGGKSEAVAEYVVLFMLSTKGGRVLCTREVQKSIKESVKSVIERKILEKGYSDFFEIVETEIRCKTTGAVCMFSGLASHTTDSIKSFDSIDLCWVEEAQTVSARSLKILIPTIRKAGSRLIFTWNPRNEFDAIEIFSKSNRESMKVHLVNYYDNKYCPKELLDEAEFCRVNSPQEYEHVWLGGYEQVTEGAYYSKQIAEAIKGGRLTNLETEKTSLIHVVQDLGGASLKSDATAMWFFQKVAKEYWFMGYWEGNGTSASEDAQLIRDTIKSLGGMLGTVYLPHDSRQKQKSSGLSTLETYQNLGFTCEVVPMVGIMDGINAVREVFNRCWFDQDKCKEGLNALRNYHEKRDPVTGRSAGADHDRWSHGADAFRYFAVEVQSGDFGGQKMDTLVRGMKQIRREELQTRLVDGVSHVVIQTSDKKKNVLTRSFSSV